MYKIVNAALLLLLCHVLVYVKADTLQAGEDDRIYRSKNFMAIVSKEAPPKDTSVAFTLKIRQKQNAKHIIAGKRDKDLYFTQLETPALVSFSDDGTMLLNVSTPNGYEARCIDKNGEILWKHLFGVDSDQGAKHMLISPNGKYAIMTFEDTCRLYSALTGEKIPSKLEALAPGKFIQNAYTSFFDAKSEVIIVKSDWRMMKYDPVNSSLIEKEIDDPTNGNYRMVLNREPVSAMYNAEQGLFAVILLNKHPDRTNDEIASTTTNWIVALDTDLSIRFGRSINACINSRIWWVDRDILVVVSYLKEKKLQVETRIYTEKQEDPIVLVDAPKTNHITYATRKGDALYYHPLGSKKSFLKYDLNKKMLLMNDNNGSPFSTDDSSDILQINKFRKE